MSQQIIKDHNIEALKVAAPPGSACGARRFQRRQTLPASFPSSNVTRSIALPG